MGNLKYFSLLMAAGMFAACSDNLENPGNGGENTPSATEGFVRVSINTPTTSGSMSRADDDNVDPAGDISLEDGTANEYKINDGVIVFFKATSGETDPDTEANFVSAYDLEGLTPQGGDGHQVSEKVVTVSKAPKVEDDESLYALVILNKPDVVVVGSDQSLTIMDGSNSGAGKKLKTTDKLSTFTEALKNQTLSTYTGSSNNGFTMCNAPLSTVPGSDNVMKDAVAKTLVPVEVYPTENDALNNDAARIYVERVVAKVTLTGFTDGEKEGATYKTYKKNVKGTTGSVYNGDVVQLKGWILNVTNKSTSLVRNVSGFNSTGWLALPTGVTNQINRFAGTSVIPMGNNPNCYRIYWAEDGNYTGSYTVADEFNTYSGATVPGDGDWNTNTADNTTTDTDHALYCLENTMEATNQDKDESTSVLLKTTYLTKFGNQATVSDQDFFICGANPIKYPNDNTIDAESGGGKVKDIITYVVEKANEVLETDIKATELSVKGTAEPGIYDNEADGKPYSDLFNYTGSAYNEKTLTTLWSAIKSQVGDIRYYKKGESYYYAAIVRHFSDTETPWSDGEAYGIQHLGRYGVVRNNWYEINVNSISGPGEPEIVVPSGPDDETEGYIRAEINVLSWAKRSQGVDL